VAKKARDTEFVCFFFAEGRQLNFKSMLKGLIQPTVHKAEHCSFCDSNVNFIFNIKFYHYKGKISHNRTSITLYNNNKKILLHK